LSSVSPKIALFQFPIRNSVRSDYTVPGGVVVVDFVFQFPIRNSVRSDFRDARDTNVAATLVSIPHSEFCSFGLIRLKRSRVK